MNEVVNLKDIHSMDMQKKIRAKRIYLPAKDLYCQDDKKGIPIDDGIQSYMSREFPMPSSSSTANYSIPITFVHQGKVQASQAEEVTHRRLCGATCPPGSAGPLWQACFQGACYAGKIEDGPEDKKRDAKLRMKEHDFVVFNIFEGKFFVTLIEVKSTCDDPDSGLYVSNPTGIKNNKRSGLHQLSDHEHILKSSCNTPKGKIQSYLFWPYLTMWTKNPTGQKIKRWEAESGKHVFRDTISSQKVFNDWFYKTVLCGESLEKSQFDSLFKRYIVMSCGVFVNEIHQEMLALLTQEQVSLMFRKPSSDGSSTIVHGAAGTGKTLLVLQKLKYLHECGLLNENNRALFICFWQGINIDFCQKLKTLNLSQYVDTLKFFVTAKNFMRKNTKKYRHIFMDECEAICMAFSKSIIDHTFEKIKSCRLTVPDEDYERNLNIERVGCQELNGEIRDSQIKRSTFPIADDGKVYGDLWFLVDINQIAAYFPQYSPQILRCPDIVLSRVMRNTGTIYKVFSEFYKQPNLALSHLAPLYLDTLVLGHDIIGPPVYWVNSDQFNDTSKLQSEFYSPTFDGLVRVVIDLLSSKGVQANDLCVIPFLVTDTYVPKNINEGISTFFVTDGFKPCAISRTEDLFLNRKPNYFLAPHLLSVKGLEFKIVVMVIEEEDFECADLDTEDKRKVYIMASRCSCLLILVSSVNVKNVIDVNKVIENYPFNVAF